MTAALARVRPPVPGTAGRLALVVVVAVAEFGLAFAAAVEPRLALAAIAGGVLLIVALIKPVPVLLLAFITVIIPYRVGPAAIDMSLADAVTIVGAIAAIPHVPWRDARLRRVLVLFAFYLGAVSISVLREPSVTAAGEVFHRALMVGGALMIGCAISRLGRARLALRAFLAVTTVVAVAAIGYAVTSGFAPAYPFDMNKNAVGAHLTTALLILLAGSAQVGLSRPVTAAVSVTLLLGLLASQSRGAALALVISAAFFLMWSRNQRLARLAPVVLALSLIMLTFAFTSLSTLTESDPNSEFNSYNSRMEAYEFAIQNAFLPHIPFGNGPKWFRSNITDSGPHNVIVAELSETGLMGTALFLVFLGGVAVTLWRMRTQLGDVALLVGMERFIDTMFGIFWVAGTGTVPWLVAGLAFGEQELDPAGDEPPGDGRVPATEPTDGDATAVGAGSTP